MTVINVTPCCPSIWPLTCGDGVVTVVEAARSRRRHG